LLVLVKVTFSFELMAVRKEEEFRGSGHMSNNNEEEVVNSVWVVRFIFEVRLDRRVLRDADKAWFIERMQLWKSFGV
jgi:hypothetical protein